MCKPRSQIFRELQITFSSEVRLLAILLQQWLGAITHQSGRTWGRSYSHQGLWAHTGLTTHPDTCKRKKWPICCKDEDPIDDPPESVSWPKTIKSRRWSWTKQAADGSPRTTKWMRSRPRLIAKKTFRTWWPIEHFTVAGGRARLGRLHPCVEAVWFARVWEAYEESPGSPGWVCGENYLRALPGEEKSVEVQTTITRMTWWMCCTSTWKPGIAFEARRIMWRVWGW